MTQFIDPIVAIVPAAGIGSRMQANCPKQYLSLMGRSLLQRTVSTLLECSYVHQIVIALAENDTQFVEAVDSHPKLSTVLGGASRAASVRNALTQIADKTPSAWALVHDAARPCVRLDRIDALVKKVMEQNRGGILAVPASDTVKRVEGQWIQSTLARETLWLAHTPQMFPVNALLKALNQGLDQGLTLTDEASAMESMGYSPLVVEDAKDNIKITHPGDLQMAEWILKHRASLT